MLIGYSIDINPLYNPYVSKDVISPKSGYIYTDRTAVFPYKISQDDALYKIFMSHGWSWGGDWSGKKDYQHFEKRT